MVGRVLLFLATKKARSNFASGTNLCLGLPVFVVAQKIVFVPIVHRGL
jgi:hypothetical protein